MSGYSAAFPPHMLEALANSEEAERQGIAEAARAALSFSAEVQSKPLTGANAYLGVAGAMAPATAQPGHPSRVIHSLNGQNPILGQVGTLVRTEGSSAIGKDSVDEAYDNIGNAYNFFWQHFQRHSLDGSGQPVVCSVEMNPAMRNAYWTGNQMLFAGADPCGVTHHHFARGLDIVTHEYTHGILSARSGLDVRGVEGAIQEHFADAFGAMAIQAKRDQQAHQAKWLVGADVLITTSTRRGLRSFQDEPGYEKDALFGTDPSVKHMDDFKKPDKSKGYDTTPYINCGILNHAFYLAASDIGGKSWQTVGPAWYSALTSVKAGHTFNDVADLTIAGATTPQVRSAITSAWRKVGVISTT